MAAEKLYIKISVPWWMIKLYIPTLILFAKLCQLFNPDARPDEDKLVNFFISHIKISKISGVKNG